jgi:DNA-binding MarR family transcriptional regulator
VVPIKRRRSDRLYPRTLGPREREALRLIERGPGITAPELAAPLGVTTNRVWQIVRRLEAGRVRRERSSKVGA